MDTPIFFSVDFIGGICMMRTARLSALLLALALLAGCTPASREDTVHFTAMDTVIQLSVYGC